MVICVCMADFLHCPPETMATLFTSYTPIENKNFKKMGQSIGEIIINIKNEKKNKQKQRIRTKGKTVFSQPRKSLHREKGERKQFLLLNSH